MRDEIIPQYSIPSEPVGVICQNVPVLLSDRVCGVTTATLANHNRSDARIYLFPSSIFWSAARRNPGEQQSHSAQFPKMKAIPRTTTSVRCLRSLTRLRFDVPPTRYVHSSSTKAAVAHPVHITGPPPKPPTPAPGYERAERRKKQADAATSSETQPPSQNAGASKPNPLKRRFWKHVDVKETESE